MTHELRSVRPPETLRINKENLIYTPFYDCGYPNIPIHLVKEFNPDFFRQNFRISKLVEHFYDSLGAKGKRGYKRGAHPLPVVNPDNAVGMVDKIANAQSSFSTFEKAAGLMPQERVELEEIKSTIKKGLMRLSGKGCIMSPSHMTDQHLIEALQEEGVNLAKVGVIIIDQHIDAGLNGGVGENPQLDKSNFIEHMFRSGIGAVSIMGIDEGDLPRIISGENSDAKFIQSADPVALTDSYVELQSGLKKLQTFYKDNQHRVHFGSGVLGESRKMNKSKKVIDSINRQIKFFKEKGVENILISFDLDSLNLLQEEITATPYNPFTVLVQLGLQDFIQILEVNGITEVEMEDGIRKMMQLRAMIDSYSATRKRKGMLSPREVDLEKAKKDEFGKRVNMIFPTIYIIEEAIRTLKYPVRNGGLINTLLNQLAGLHTMTSDEGGFSVDQATFLVDQIKKASGEQGLEVGVPIGNGRIMGTVSELDGPDVNGNGAQAAIKIINSITS